MDKVGLLLDAEKEASFKVLLTLNDIKKFF